MFCKSSQIGWLHCLWLSYNRFSANNYFIFSASAKLLDFSSPLGHFFLLLLFLVLSCIRNEVKTHLRQGYLLSGLTLLFFRSIFISRKISAPDTYPNCNTVGFSIICVYEYECCVIYSVSASLCHHLSCVKESGVLLESDVRCLVAIFTYLVSFCEYWVSSTMTHKCIIPQVCISCIATHQSDQLTARMC